MDRARDNEATAEAVPREGEPAKARMPVPLHGLHCPEVRVRTAIVLTVVYRVAGSMRIRRGHGSRRAVPPRPARRHTMPRLPVIFCSNRATAGAFTRTPGPVRPTK